MKQKFDVTGMSCSACSAHVEKAVSKVAGVDNVNVNLLGGSMLVEVVFSWKGMGTLIYDAVNTKDFPILQTCFLFIGICVVAFNLLADVLNMLIDPRLREEDRHA